MDSQVAISTTMYNEKKNPLIFKVLLVLGMVSFMGGSLTGLMTYFNLGYTENFFSDWFSSFLIAAVTVMPAGIVVITLLTKLAMALLPSTNEKIRNAIVGISMAFIMESAMAFTTTLNNVGFDSLAVFFNTWVDTLLAALPLALTLILIISMTIKPKIERFLKS